MIKDIHSKVSNMGASLAALLTEVASIKSLANSTSKVPESIGTTNQNQQLVNRSKSPFLSPNGELIVSTRVSTTKRKLDVDNTQDADKTLAVVENTDFENEEQVNCFDIDSFSIRNIRFNEAQFPPGLETLKDLIEKHNEAL